MNLLHRLDEFAARMIDRLFGQRLTQATNPWPRETRHPIKQAFPARLIAERFAQAGVALTPDEEGDLYRALQAWSGNERFYWKRSNIVAGGLNDFEITLPTSP